MTTIIMIVSNIMSVFTLLYVLWIMAVHNLTITSWNVRSINKATPYINELLNYHNSDVLCISEHRLYEHELYKLNEIANGYDVVAKSSHDLNEYNQSRKPGHCGIALFYRKSLSHRIKSVEVNSDRICAIEVVGAYDNRSLFIINVYLPHQSCTISNFKEHVDILHELIIKCQIHGEIVIIGDTNCNFGRNIGHRFSGISTGNANYFKHVIDQCELDIVDGMELCQGARYSFHVDGIGTSYVDHCVTSKLVTANTINCEVLEDCLLNTSDHLPVQIIVSLISHINVSPNVKMSKVAWHKLSDEDVYNKYTVYLNDRLDYICEQIDNMEYQSSIGKNIVKNIDKTLHILVESMIDVSSNLPHTKYNCNLKPYWSKLLSAHSKRKKAAWFKWIQRDRPRDDDPDFLDYKAAKLEFKKQLSNAKLLYDSQNIKDINESQDIDHVYFWKLVSRNKKCQNSSVHPLRLKNGTLVTDPDDIRQAWKVYFEELFTPVHNDKFDNDFKEYVESQIKMYQADCNLYIDDILRDHLTLAEVKSAIMSLKIRKHQDGTI